MSDDAPSTSRLAGQLGYLFEEEPELATHPPPSSRRASTTRTATPAPASSTCSRATSSCATPRRVPVAHHRRDGRGSAAPGPAVTGPPSRHEVVECQTLEIDDLVGDPDASL